MKKLLLIALLINGVSFGCAEMPREEVSPNYSDIVRCAKNACTAYQSYKSTEAQYIDRKAIKGQLDYSKDNYVLNRAKVKARTRQSEPKIDEVIHNNTAEYLKYDVYKARKLMSRYQVGERVATELMKEGVCNEID